MTSLILFSNRSGISLICPHPQLCMSFVCSLCVHVVCGLFAVCARVWVCVATTSIFSSKQSWQTNLIWPEKGQPHSNCLSLTLCTHPFPPLLPSLLSVASLVPFNFVDFKPLLITLVYISHILHSSCIIINVLLPLFALEIIDLTQARSCLQSPHHHISIFDGTSVSTHNEYVPWSQETIITQVATTSLQAQIWTGRWVQTSHQSDWQPGSTNRPTSVTYSYHSNYRDTLRSRGDRCQRSSTIFLPFAGQWQGRDGKRRHPLKDMRCRLKCIYKAPTSLFNPF